MLLSGREKESNPRRGGVACLTGRKRRTHCPSQALISSSCVTLANTTPARLLGLDEATARGRLGHFGGSRAFHWRLGVIRA